MNQSTYSSSKARPTGHSKHSNGQGFPIHPRIDEISQASSSPDNQRVDNDNSIKFSHLKIAMTRPMVNWSTVFLVQGKSLLCHQAYAVQAVVSSQWSKERKTVVGCPQFDHGLHSNGIGFLFHGLVLHGPYVSLSFLGPPYYHFPDMSPAKRNFVLVYTFKT